MHWAVNRALGAPNTRSTNKSVCTYIIDGIRSNTNTRSRKHAHASSNNTKNNKNAHTCEPTFIVAMFAHTSAPEWRCNAQENTTALCTCVCVCVRNPYRVSLFPHRVAHKYYINRHTNTRLTHSQTSFARSSNSHSENVLYMGACIRNVPLDAQVSLNCVQPLSNVLCLHFSPTQAAC